MAAPNTEFRREPSIAGIAGLLRWVAELAWGRPGSYDSQSTRQLLLPLTLDLVAGRPPITWSQPELEIR